MLKVRIIPILTFNGFALVKTKQFAQPRMVGNPVQAARVYNSRGVDELIFLDIFATAQKRKINLNVVKEVIKECFMPVGIGGGIKTLDDINDLLRIGADKVVLKECVFANPAFIKEASHFFGAQCISIAVDAKKDTQGNYKIHNLQGEDIDLISFINKVEELGAGELIVNAVDNDGMMKGFDTNLVNQVLSNTSLPTVCVGGGGSMEHFEELFSATNCEAVGAASIFHFTQFTPLDIKNTISKIGKPVRK